MASQAEPRPSSSSSPASAAPHTHVHLMRGCSPVTKYELLEKLGEGTFGYISIHIATYDSEVWKARRRDSKQLFALKKILMHNEKEGVCSAMGFKAHVG